MLVADRAAFEDRCAVTVGGAGLCCGEMLELELWIAFVNGLEGGYGQDSQV